MELMYQIVYELPDGKGFRYSGGYTSKWSMDQAIAKLEAQGATIVRIERGMFRPAEDAVSFGPSGPLIPP
jgi:hypothetical protein